MITTCTPWAFILLFYSSIFDFPHMLSGFSWHSPGMRCTRLDILTASLAAVAITSPRSATAFDLQTALAIAPLAQYSQSIEDIDSFLFSGLLQQQQPPPVGIPSEHGATTRKLVTKLLKEGRARQLSQDATAAALEARVLTRAQAAEVERHAKEAEECLAAIVEADAATGLNRDALNYELTFMRPTELRFYHRALLTAQAEIDLAYGCFGDDERQAATMLSKRAATATSGPRLTSAERDALVVAALDTLPSPVGTFLTRGDLQRKLDDAYVEKRRRGRPDPEFERELVDLAKDTIEVFQRDGSR